MDSKFKGKNTWSRHPEYDNGFKAGQQSKQAEINEIKSKIQELWTELDDRQSKEYIIEKCEVIIQDLLK